MQRASTESYQVIFCLLKDQQFFLQLPIKGRQPFFSHPGVLFLYNLNGHFVLEGRKHTN